MKQVTQVWRRLAAAPGFTAAAILMVALGIASNTAVFAVVRGVLLKPLPYPNPDKLVSVLHTAPGLNIPGLACGPANYFVYRDQSRTFASFGLWSGDSVSVTGIGEPEQVDAVDVTREILPMLGARTTVGSLFSAQNDAPNTPLTAILSFSYWKQRFGGDRSIVGRRVIIDGRPRAIMGVLSPDFRFLDEHPQVFLPQQFDRAKTFLGNFSYDGIARLQPGATMTAANADVARMLKITERTFPIPPGFTLAQFHAARIGPNLRGLRQQVIGDVGRTLWILMASVGTVLLVACANIANLLLVRAEGRQQELSIRAALGASWSKVAFELASETFVLAVLGGAIGVALAYAALRGLVAFAPVNLPRVNEISIDGHVVLFTLCTVVAAALIASILPVVKYARRGIGFGLRQISRTASESRERHNARNLLIILQVTLALVLLIGSGLMIRTARALLNVNPGFADPQHVETVTLMFPSAQIENPDQLVQTQKNILDSIAAIPGVHAVAASQSVPMDGNNNFDPLFPQNEPNLDSKLAIHRYQYLSPGYFHTMQTPLIAGRDFTWDDIMNKRSVMIVSESLARLYWHDARDAIGKMVLDRLGSPLREVIGVAADVHWDGLNKPAPTVAYWPIVLKDFEGDAVSVRRMLVFNARSARAGSQSLASDIRRAIWRVNSGIPLAGISTVGSVYKRSLARTSFTLTLLSIASAMALLLGVVGLYGVVAYSVSRRRREIGVRVAVGAQPAQLLRMFVVSGFSLAAVGVGIGVCFSLAVMRLLSSVLFGVSPFDPATYAIAAVALLASACAASYFPALRALAVNGSEALRAE